MSSRGRLVQGRQQPPTAGVHLALVSEIADVGRRWELDARCRGSDGGIFFGPHGFESKRDRAAREEAAKAICAGCPALVACREHALQQEELYGVWGGMGEAERRAALERNGRVARAG